MISLSHLGEMTAGTSESSALALLVVHRTTGTRPLFPLSVESSQEEEVLISPLWASFVVDTGQNIVNVVALIWATSTRAAYYTGARR